ncbi:msc1 protein [Diplodia corticola]|uniref:Msc1 protein n=1 Tax=Diplodia corticola TaxID=236234 RepID=A0A1J9SJ69_9PEZI|nr:msc1 protein [Diplodia corticola]OJD39796.1 msc1 protein [Diplodia corticola]
MRFNIVSTLVVALAAESAVASTWFGKAAYNKWHETELERWLSDHDVPYPTPADRKDLENLVKDNWNAKVAQPYNSWDTQQLQSYLGSKGQDVKKGAEQNKDSLVASVKAYWYETEDQASNAYNSVKDWIFDSWTDSQLKAFLDRHGIPSPQPRTRDTLLKAARENYQSAATKVGETAAYPGDWLYESWSESDLKAWLDERGYPAPQSSTRDKLIASVRRNSRLASESMRSAQSSASASAASVQASLTDSLLDAWSDSQVKEWLDKNGVKVPQGSKRNELIALARKHRAKLTGDNVEHSVTSAYGAATSKAGNQYAQATDDASLKANQAYGAAGSYIDWIKQKLGLAASDASASASSAASAASSGASSVGSQASKDAKGSAAAATDAVNESASAAKHRASEAAQQATDKVKEEL